MKKILLALTASASLIGMGSAVLAQTATPPPPAVLGGTGLSTGATAGLIGAGVVLLIALGSDGVTTTPVTP